ncbi:NADP-dependent oxidoreductase domain-containing protein [Zychaea mexicana]|uniref:NADP-dependent oxidoreductase domain-containing protein n=1 Tax=Zychaea mexicana TaxID=64656 RepID=UPI0022FE6411|nr:NADP-dependent oxidoreductase domain-containing protein [Zychaea mexicana]KAI9497564.1 NADP-dependent oxidoreductase domain-containing protein [Zychaea mexicana]
MSTSQQTVCQTDFRPSELGFGAGALSGTYDKIESHWPVEACREALRGGINVFDTSPYYGASEFVLGDALEAVRDEFPRSTYYIQTKVGRYGVTTKDFDYRAERILDSVKESMRRLRTDYLDLVLCHDVEFVDFQDVVGPGGALEALFKLKAEGKIKYVGCSAYPLPVLLKIAEHQAAKGQPLDVILSYCHYTLQNTKLAEYTPKFRAAGVRYVANASPLGMALFRDAGPPQWHPAHAELRNAAKQSAEYAKENGLNISELASMFAFTGRDIFQLNTTYIGLENKEDVQKALAAWKRVKDREQDLEKPTETETKVLDKVRELLATYKDYSWQSPTPRELA